MKNFRILTESINFIEQNLCEPITREEVAGHCFVSLSMLEKLYRYALHRSIKEYISKRRMTQAAADLTGSGLSITDIAFKYQYHSVEVFSRAFQRVWNIRPSEFIRHWKFTGIQPRINYEYLKGEDLDMASKKVDISDAYDYFLAHAGSYVLCFDAQHLMEINSISRKAGDLAILEIARRIDQAATEEMLVLRIGGDEFALVTGYHQHEKAEALAAKVLSHNGEPFLFEYREYPLSLWCGITIVPKHPRYSEFFTEMHNTINRCKT